MAKGNINLFYYLKGFYLDQAVSNSFSNVGRFIPSEGCGGDKSKTYCEEDERYPDLRDITPKLTEKQLGILEHK